MASPIKCLAFNLIHFIDEIPFERSERQGFGDSILGEAL